MFLINSYFNILDGILAVICEVIPSTALVNFLIYTITEAGTINQIALILCFKKVPQA